MPTCIALPHLLSLVSSIPSVRLCISVPWALVLSFVPGPLVLFRLHFFIESTFATGSMPESFCLVRCWPTRKRQDQRCRWRAATDRQLTMSCGSVTLHGKVLRCADGLSPGVVESSRARRRRRPRKQARRRVHSEHVITPGSCPGSTRVLQCNGSQPVTVGLLIFWNALDA